MPLVMMLDRRKSLFLFLTLLPLTLALRSHESQHHTLDASIERHQQHHDLTAETNTETMHQSRNILRAWVRRDHLGRWHYHSEITRDTRTYIPPHDAIAWLLFEPLAHTQGWDILSLATSPHANDMEQAYGAGYVEGIATHVRIYQLWSTIGKKRHPDVDTYIAKQDTFLRQRVASITPDHPEYVYWTHIGLILAQLDGLVAGYATTVTDPKYAISLYDFWAMQLDGDMKDIERTLKVSERCDTMSRTQLLEFIATEGHCSAMIKWTHDDLLVTHATWADYEELLKMYKHYRFAFSDPHVKSQLSSFSSYPGFIWSSDDFYILDTGLVVTETTITILNDDLYENIPDSSVTSWLRTTIANRLSHTGHEWTTWFSRYNSGTYNCQWMIIDYKRFVKGAELKPGTLWLLEQIPGRIQIRDLTPLLSSTTYWSSNNLPYFMEINEASMYQHYATRYGEILEYEKSTRSKIMRREQEKITSLASLKRLARLNQYTIDPVSAGCPGEAIAARYDLAPMNGVKCDSGVILNGAVDAKVVNAAMVATMTSETVLGPSSDDQPPFDWSKIKSRTKPLGQPWKFDFGWIRTRPRL